MDTDKEDQVTIDLSNITNNTNLWIDGHSDVYTISPSSSPYIYPNNSPSWTFSDLSITSPPQAKIELRGEDADIEINGESIVGMLKDIRDRLNILQVSEEMEAEWDELRVLREQYEVKLTQCREKSAIWKTLKHEN